MTSADMILWLGNEGDGPHHPQLVEIDAKCDETNHAGKSAAAFRVSALSGEGMNVLVRHIINIAKMLLPPPDRFAINQRQRILMGDCAKSLKEASNCSDWLIVAEQLRQARLSLDALTGRAHTEDMLDTLFGRFCVGK